MIGMLIATFGLSFGGFLGAGYVLTLHVNRDTHEYPLRQGWLWWPIMLAMGASFCLATAVPIPSGVQCFIWLAALVTMIEAGGVWLARHRRKVQHLDLMRRLAGLERRKRP